jgi:2-polyprenyl-3-methyl-5-hydroxy-6-metoxy-1,4-benzoquinol methylase
MNQELPLLANPPDPQWGDQDRPEKAAAIFTTLRLMTGLDFSNSHWVDVGCGCGEIAAHLAPQVGRMTAIDPSPWQRWSKLKDAHPNLEFVQGDYTGDYPAPNSIDVVVCNQVYEHVPDPEALIRFIHRILKPGGYAYFAGPNLLFPIEPHVFWPFVHWLPRRFAVKLMKLCGAKYVVDANSVSIWRLRHWLRKFEVNNAFPTLVRHADHYGRTGLFWGMLSIIPHTILDHLTFFSPGFVFVLHKRT